MDKAPEGQKWEGGVGYLTPELAKQQLPKPSDDNLILVCGPPPMMKAISGDKAPDKSQGAHICHLRQRSAQSILVSAFLRRECPGNGQLCFAIQTEIYNPKGMEVSSAGGHSSGRDSLCNYNSASMLHSLCSASLCRILGHFPINECQKCLLGGRVRLGWLWCR